MSDGKKWLEMAARDKMLTVAFFGKMTAALQVTDTDVASEMKATMKAEMRVALAAMKAEMAEGMRLIEAAAREEHVRLGANPPVRLYAWI